MKAYGRKAFLALPVDIVYCLPHASMSVKGETLHSNDFASLDLGWIDAGSEYAAGPRFKEMLAAGASYPMDSAFDRDGNFEDADVYLVYEPADLDRIIEYCQKAKEVAS